MGLRSATTDLAQIETWWTAQPDANIAVCGDPHATDKFLLRVDVDPKRGGDEAWRNLVRKNACHDTLMVRTPSGGFHLYFWTEQAYGNGTGALPEGIDIRGHLSGYTVGAPSTTANVPGESVAGRYDVEKQSPIVYAPEWLLTLLDTVKQRDEPVEPAVEIDDDAYNELRDALMSPAMLRDWDRWSDNGLALRSLGDRGYQLWLEYSQKQILACPERETGTDTAETWWRRHGTTGLKSDYRSIFARAQARGWQNPKSFDPSTLGFGQSPLPAGAITTVTTAVAAALPSTRRFQLLSEAEFTDGPDPDWRVDNVLPAEGIAMVYGPSGVGKSFFTLDVLGCIADGRAYGAKQHVVKRGRVVYVMAEGAGGMRKRVRAYRQRYPATHSNFNIIAAAPNLMTPADVGEICNAIMESGGADVIVFDTMANCMAGGEENSAKDITILMTNARTISNCFKALVVFVHHTGKDETRGSRGSSSIKGHCETQIEILHNPTDPRRRVARIEKQRDGDGDLAWEYELEPVIMMGDKPCSSAVVKHNAREVSSESKKHRRTQSQSLVSLSMQSLQDQYPDGAPLEILIAEISRRRNDMRPDNIKRSITKAIDEGELSIDSDSMVKLAWN